MSNENHNNVLQTQDANEATKTTAMATTTTTTSAAAATATTANTTTTTTTPNVAELSKEQIEHHKNKFELWVKNKYLVNYKITSTAIRKERGEIYLKILLKEDPGTLVIWKCKVVY